MGSLVESNLIGKKKKIGRPSRLNQKLIDKIYLFSALGATEEQICSVFDIPVDTFNTWKRSEVFAAALKKAKENPDDLIENSLFLRAKGMEVTERIVEKDQFGKIVQRQITKQLPPDTTACIFWLKNRRRDRWRDQPDMGAGGITAINIQLISANGKNHDEIEIKSEKPTEEIQAVEISEIKK